MTQSEMDGVLYNQSPANSKDNFYLPYFECWKRFNMSELADKIENYNNEYIEALKEFENDNSKDFSDYFLKYKLELLG